MVLEKISDRKLANYLKSVVHGNLSEIKITVAYSDAFSTYYSLQYKKAKKTERKLLCVFNSDHFNMDSPSGRIQAFLDRFSKADSLKSHLRPLDIAYISKGDAIISFDNPKDAFILLEEAEGTDFLVHLLKISRQDSLTQDDRDRIAQIAEYLVNLHSYKRRKGADQLYSRAIREIICGPESLMSAFDAYPSNIEFADRDELSHIIKLSVDRWNHALSFSHRLSETHGNFTPDNIYFKGKRMTLTDAGRSQFGEPADDIAAFILFPILISVIDHGSLTGIHKEVFDLFWNIYFKETHDREMREIIAPFLAYRIAMVCNPLIYSDDFFNTPENAAIARTRLINLAINALEDEEFDPGRINHYLLKQHEGS